MNIDINKMSIISMTDYLTIYLNPYLDNKIRDADVFKLFYGKATHKNIESLFNSEYIQKVPFNGIDDDTLLKDDILLVEDFANELAPYIKPEIINQRKERRRK